MMTLVFITVCTGNIVGKGEMFSILLKTSVIILAILKMSGAALNFGQSKILPFDKKLKRSVILFSLYGLLEKTCTS